MHYTAVNIHGTRFDFDFITEDQFILEPKLLRYVEIHTKLTTLAERNSNRQRTFETSQFSHRIGSN